MKVRVNLLCVLLCLCSWIQIVKYILHVSLTGCFKLYIASFPAVFLHKALYILIINQFLGVHVHKKTFEQPTTQAVILFGIHNNLRKKKKKIKTSTMQSCESLQVFLKELELYPNSLHQRG